MANEYRHIPHGFDPVFDGRSRVLVLGSFPSVLSRENRFYYGNPRNRFWTVAAAVLGAPVPPNEPIEASIAAKKALLLEGGIALWDVVASCDIKGSSGAPTTSGGFFPPRPSRPSSPTGGPPKSSIGPTWNQQRACRFGVFLPPAPPTPLGGRTGL